MISVEHYYEIAFKNGEFASWAVWAEVGVKPKSNNGDMSAFIVRKITIARYKILSEFEL